jgi:hypothetical protein
MRFLAHLIVGFFSCASTNLRLFTKSCDPLVLLIKCVKTSACITGISTEFYVKQKFECCEWDLNPRMANLESAALTTLLSQLDSHIVIIWINFTVILDCIKYYNQRYHFDQGKDREKSFH